MHGYWILVPIAALVLTAGVAAGEIVVFPAKGQSADRQSRDESECRQWAQKKIGVDPVAVAEQATAGQKSDSSAKSGAGGALGGAGMGAARGAASGNAAAGAAQGAVRGRLIARMRSRRQEEQQQAGAAQNAELRRSWRNTTRRTAPA